jgi:hypothetical protein
MSMRATFVFSVPDSEGRSKNDIDANVLEEMRRSRFSGRCPGGANDSMRMASTNPKPPIALGLRMLLELIWLSVPAAAASARLREFYRTPTHQCREWSAP